MSLGRRPGAASVWTVTVLTLDSQGLSGIFTLP